LEHFAKLKGVMRLLSKHKIGNLVETEAIPGNGGGFFVSENL